MKFNLIYGRSGSGKSKYIYEDVKNKICDKNIFIIVPEQSNLTAERKLFEITERKSLINVEVLTLSRMAYRIQNEVCGNKEVHLSKVGKDMLIYNLLTKYKTNLKFLGRSDKNVETINNMFTEFKKHNISLNNLYDVEIKDKYTKLKLDDIKFLYEKYEEKLKNNFIDENDILNILAENIEKSKLFENSLIYIDEFLGFTPQEYKVFEKLIKKCEEMTVSVCLDNIDNKTNMETDIFYFNKVFARKLIDIANKNGCEIEKVSLESGYRFKSQELRSLEKNLYQTKEKYKENVENAISKASSTYLNNTQNFLSCSISDAYRQVTHFGSDIKIFLASNPYSELEYVAKNIHNLVKNCGYQYNEIGIITQNIDEYSEDAKVIFSKYEIPLFIDEKKSLNQNVLVKYIIAMLEIFSRELVF